MGIRWRSGVARRCPSQASPPCGRETASFSSTVVGDYDNSVNILSLQLTWAL
jgi:hypothetical protein